MKQLFTGANPMIIDEVGTGLTAETDRDRQVQKIYEGMRANKASLELKLRAKNIALCVDLMLQNELDGQEHDANAYRLEAIDSAQWTIERLRRRKL